MAGTTWLLRAVPEKPVQSLVLALLILAGFGIELVVHAYLGVSIVYTHFFYLIIVITGLWFGRRAILLALLFGGLHLVVTYLLVGAFPFDALLRAAMLCIVAFVIGTVVEEMSRYRCDLEKRNAQLQASENAFQTANRKMNLLSSITRHDIVNQLTILLGRVDLLADEATSPAMLAGLEGERESIRTIQRLIAFTKDYEEIGVHAPQWQQVAGCPERYRGSNRLAGIALAVALDDLEIYADPMLELICENLIDNSLRHGGAMTRIRFSFEVSGPGLIILYEDDGVGVPAEEKERIFEKGVGKHTGFGLFLSREILAITGLSIRETGVYGQGARFEILVPKGKYRFAERAQPAT